MDVGTRILSLHDSRREVGREVEEWMHVIHPSAIYFIVIDLLAGSSISSGLDPSFCSLMANDPIPMVISFNILYSKYYSRDLVRAKV